MPHIEYLVKLVFLKLDKIPRPATGAGCGSPCRTYACELLCYIPAPLTLFRAFMC